MNNNSNVLKYKKALNNIKPSKKLKANTLNKIMNKEIIKEIYNENETNKNIKFKKVIYPLTTVLASVCIVFSILLVNDNLNNQDFIQQIIQDKDEPVLSYQEKDILPKVGSIENLNNLLGNYRVNEEYKDLQMETDEDAADSILGDSTTYSSDSIEYSKTNIQVEGVDEADIVKTDGEYIYYIANKKLYIVNVKNPNNIVIENDLGFEEQIEPKELYINNKKLILILDKLDKLDNNRYYAINSTICYDVAYMETDTVVITYELRGASNLVEKRRIEINGRYLDSRMIGNEVYFITSKYVNQNEEGEIVLPEYKDTIIDNEQHKVNIEKMLYVPDSSLNNFLTIAGFNIEDKKEVNTKTILGAGEEIYCTNTNMYITSTKYEGRSTGYHTDIYKFKLIDTNIISIAVGETKGRPLTQFSMSEYDNRFSIVTTNEIWKTSTRISTKNDLYIFDENLQQIGILENIGGDESLKSVRFMKDKAYVVTFKRTDPLFVIDISNESGTEPKILGELEIPGYSSYLHPYDETHIIGIGQDVEIETRYYGEVEVQKGVKISLFDVSDYSNPKELYSLVLDEKSYTNVQYNHKAVLFSKDKNILALPISSNANGEFKNQYVVLNIDLEKGISIKGYIDHGYVETEYGYKYMVGIDRGLYIDNYLYTLSSKMIEVRNLNNFYQIGKSYL